MNTQSVKELYETLGALIQQGYGELPVLIHTSPELQARSAPGCGMVKAVNLFRYWDFGSKDRTTVVRITDEAIPSAPKKLPAKKSKKRTTTTSDIVETAATV